MAQITSEYLAMLRQRLRAWLSAQTEPVSEETLTEQIDHLLEEVLHEPPPLTEPLPSYADEQDEDHRVVVTGLGLVTPFGLDIAPFWSGLKNGRSAIRPITLCDVSDFPCKIAGEVPDFDPQQFMSARDARRMSRGSQFAVAAAHLALRDADLIINEDNQNESGALIACGSTSFPETEQTVRALLLRGTTRVSPLYISTALPHMASSQVALQLGLQGYNSSISTVGAASAQAIGEAAAVIRRGDAVVMLAGGAEAPISRLSLASLHAMRTLSARNAEPARASRPFDARRDGFVLSEGAGVLVLERLSYARKRGATIYAEVAGYGSTYDAYHITAPEPHGEGAARAMLHALRNAQIGPQQVDYINAHASGTRQGDRAETLAIKHACNEYAFSIPVSATKSMIGHLTGAAGSVQAAAALLALRHGVLPPTINLDDPDPDCDLDYVPNVARPAEMQTVLTNSFAMGGVNAVLVFRSLDSYE